MGRVKAFEFCFSGEPMDVAEAERLGVVNRVVPAAQLEAEVEIVRPAHFALAGVLEGALERGDDVLGAGFGVGGDDEDGGGAIRACIVAGFEIGAVLLRDDVPDVRIDEVRERETDAQASCERAAEIAGAEHPQFGSGIDLGLQDERLGMAIQPWLGALGTDRDDAEEPTGIVLDRVAGPPPAARLDRRPRQSAGARAGLAPVRQPRPHDGGSALMTHVPPLSYRDTGVDRDAADSLLRGLGRWGLAGGRAGVRQAAGGYAAVASFGDGPALAVTTDGVGTKLLLALEAGEHRGIGQDVVAMSVNDLLCAGATPWLFLDYLAAGALVPSVARVVLAGIGRACARAGCLWVGGETAELPGLLPPAHYDVAGFCVGLLPAERRLPRRPLQPGDALIGLASSGFHANGFSLVRKLLDQPLPPRLPAATRDRATLVRTLLRPTRLYGAATATVQAQVLAAAHISGSGWRNLTRMDAGVSYAVTLPPLSQRAPVFLWLQRLDAVPFAEAASTFNLGVGLVIVVAAGDADAVLSRLATNGERAWRLGQVVARDRGQAATVHVRGPEGEAALRGRIVTGRG